MRRYWRRIEVLSIVFALLFFPLLLVTLFTPSGQGVGTYSVAEQIEHSPLSLALRAAPIVGAWLILELLQLFMVLARKNTKPLSTSAETHWYFFAWVIYAALSILILLSFLGSTPLDVFSPIFGDFYPAEPVVLRWGLIGFVVIGWLKLTPVIFRNRYVPTF